MGKARETPEAIRIRGTVIRTPDNTTVLVPNRQMLGEKVTNLTVLPKDMAPADVMRIMSIIAFLIALTLPVLESVRRFYPEIALTAAEQACDLVVLTLGGFLGSAAEPRSATHGCRDPSSAGDRVVAGPRQRDLRRLVQGGDHLRREGRRRVDEEVRAVVAVAPGRLGQLALQLRRSPARIAEQEPQSPRRLRGQRAHGDPGGAGRGSEDEPVRQRSGQRSARMISRAELPHRVSAVWTVDVLVNSKFRGAHVAWRGHLR